MRAVAVTVLLLLSGCLEVGPEIQQRHLELAVEGPDARIVVREAGGVDWSELTASIADCADASMSSTAHLGSDPPYVNDRATSSGAPLYDRRGEEAVDCPNPTDARISKVPKPVRPGDFLQMCTTPVARICKPACVGRETADQAWAFHYWIRAHNRSKDTACACITGFCVDNTEDGVLRLRPS